jgi:putative inorganic carbon (hco3(-)) transporter
MRDIAITALLLASVPFILRRPIFGIFMWVWVSVMSPHRLTWDYAYNLPFAAIIAIATLVGMLFSKEPKHLPITPVTVVLFLLTVWMNVTTAFALHPAESLEMWDKVMKIMFMVFVTMYLLHSKQHVQVLILIVTLSVAFFGVKGGLFTLRGGGEFRVYGPGGSFIEENNSLALALIMTIPLLQYLYLQMKNRWLRLGLLTSMLLCGFAALGSHSRGALLGVSGMLTFLWLKSHNKIITAFVLILLVPAAITFMPQKWEERMRSIQNYEQDGSAMGRINAWKMTVNLANDRLVGGGFSIYDQNVFARYAPNPTDVHSAHSIYFQMLGEHGYVGLLLYLLLWGLVWRDASWIIKQARSREGWRWASDLSRMTQVALAGFAVGGAFLNLAYYDVPYYLLAAIVLTRLLLEKELKGVDQKVEIVMRPQIDGVRARRKVSGDVMRDPAQAADTRR